MTKNKFCLLFFTLWYCFASLAQGTHTTRFNFSDYNGGHENWDICKIGPNLVIANQQGLLFFQNGNWSINPVPENIAPKAVYFQNQKLYTAFGSRFGYFNIKNNVIVGNFNPIILPREAKLFSVVWKIVSNGDHVYFQTDKNVIVVKDTVVVKTLPFSGFVRCIYKVNKDIYFVDQSKGLLKNFRPVPYGETLANKEINVILPFKDGSLLISDNTSKTFLKYKNLQFQAIFDSVVINQYPFCGIKSKNGFLIGTTENGVYEISESGKILNHYNKKNYLAFDKVFNMFFDENNILWIGLENGLQRIRFDLPFRNIGFDNVYGNSLNVEILDSTTMFLTSNGIFECRTENIFSNNPNLIKRWNNTNGPHYFIKKIGDSYIYGHLNGFSEYKNGSTKTIIKGNSSEIKKINDQFFLVKVENDWILFNQDHDSLKMVKKLQLPSKFIVLEDKFVWNYGNEIIVQNFTSNLNLLEKQNFKISESIERMFLKNDSLFFTNSLGTYFIKSANNKKIVSKKYSNQTIYKVDYRKTLVDPIRLNREVYYDSNFKLQNQCSNFIFEILKINKDKIIFIKQINDSLLVIGSYRGFTLVNVAKIKPSNTIKINGFEANFKNGDKEITLDKLDNEVLSFNGSDLTIEIYINEQFFPMTPTFRYKYEKDNEKVIGDWQESLYLKIEDLKSGNYKIWVESRDWFGNTKETYLGSFKIEKEHPLNLLIKLTILLIISTFLLAALRSALKKKKEFNTDFLEKE